MPNALFAIYPRFHATANIPGPSPPRPPLARSAAITPWSKSMSSPPWPSA